MRKKDRIQLLRRDVELCEPHYGPATGIELQLYGRAIIAVVAIAYQCTRASQTFERRRTSLRPGERYQKAWRRACIWNEHQRPVRNNNSANDKNLPHAHSPGTAIDRI